MSSSSYDTDEDNENEWTDICRICLGPDEEGFSLSKPCICAGTIAHVHQKCLEATIAEKRSHKCPVCHYEYKFKPKYAPNTPTHLSTTQVISGLVLRAANKWIPFLLRLLLVLTVWLGILPIVTSYMYQGWMHNPSSIRGRINTKSALSDTICGLEITATIVISFLALMSLVEHFRFNWQPRRQRLRQEAEERARVEVEERAAAAAMAEEERQRRQQQERQRQQIQFHEQQQQQQQQQQQHEQEQQQGLGQMQQHQLLHLRNLHLHQQQNGYENYNNNNNQLLLQHNHDEIDDYMEYKEKSTKSTTTTTTAATANEDATMNEDRIIDEDFVQMLNNAGFELNQKIENGFVTTEEEEDESYGTLRQRRKEKSINKLPPIAKGSSTNNKLMLHQHDNGMDDMDDMIDGGSMILNTKETYGQDDKKGDAEEEMIKGNNNMALNQRKSIGVMDEGQVIISEELIIDLQSSFHNLEGATQQQQSQHMQQHYKKEQHEHNSLYSQQQQQQQQQQHQYQDETNSTTTNDDLISRASSFHSLDDIYNETAWIKHQPEFIHEHQQSVKQRYVGTPRRYSKSKQEFLKRQILDNMDIDIDSDDDDDDDDDDNNNIVGLIKRKVDVVDDNVMNDDRVMKPAAAAQNDDDDDDDDDDGGGKFTPSRRANGILRNKVGNSSTSTNKQIYERPLHLQQQEEDDDDDGGHLDEAIERMMRLQEEAEEEEDEHLFNFDQDDNVNNDMGPRNNNGADNNPFEPQFVPLDPAPRANDDQMDMEGAMPIDEVIGLAGPLSNLFRNLVWFIAFNTSYLAIFVFIPSIIGSITYSELSRSRLVSYLSSFFFNYALLLPYTRFSPEDDATAQLKSVLALLDEKAKERDNLLKPNDIGFVCLGYLTFAVSIFIMQAMVEYYQKYIKEQSRNDTRQGNIRHEGVDRNANNINDGDVNIVVAEKLGDLMECAAAITKVVILIFLKMVFLPFLLGLWLDVSTLELYKSSISERVAFAGMDVVGFFLLHWLVGITFMLTVTVSVLQFREVLHPDILAKIIRPQESQTDMIENLLQDDGWTHFKRIIPSIGIYAGLLMLHIWLPAILLSKAGLDHYIPLFRPKVWYIFSQQLQVPLELMAFHLLMLSILEKHKNKIGENQHAFLLNICHKLNLTNILLPQAIGKYKLRAMVPLRLKMNGAVISPKIELRDGRLKATFIDPFWENLLDMHENDGPTDAYIESYLETLPSNEDIEKHLDATESFQSYIALPIFEKSKSNTPAPTAISKKLLPPKIGKFRFRKGLCGDGLISIQIWQEEMGDPVPRPPEGWDYLGDNGGAVEQGRWAWQKEAKSDIETSLAQRKKLFPTIIKDGIVMNSWKSMQYWKTVIPLLIKILFLIVLCWFSVTCCIYGAISIPLAIGRSLFKLFGVPDSYIHDPLVFVIGGSFFYPMLVKVSNFVCSKAATVSRNQGVKDLLARIQKLFVTIPRRKIMILLIAGYLWFIVSPFILGLTYDLLFLSEDSTFDHTMLYLSHLTHVWAIGTTLLNACAALCHMGAFQNDFWRRVGRLPVNENNNNNNNNNEQNNDRQNDQHNAPQAGPLKTFVKLVSSVIMTQEWDKIDKDALLDNSLIPIMKVLLFALVVPVTASFACGVFAQKLGIYIASRQKLHRYFTVMCFAGILLNSYKQQILKWFKSAHDAAKDQRYLMGQILLDRVA